MIRIFNKGFHFITEIDAYESLLWTRRWHKSGEFQVIVNQHMQNVDELKEGRIITNGHKAGIIAHIEETTSKGGKGSDQLLIKGYDLKGLISKRITIPPVGQSYDRLTANAETIIKGYVERNAVNTTSERVIPNFTIAPNQFRGQSLFYQTRFKPLHEELEKISIATGIGWDVFFNGNGYEFDVLEGRNLTTTQNDNPPVIFSAEFDNVKEQKMIESSIGYKNVAIVAGQGEGVERDIAIVGEVPGLERNEVYVDARDVEDSNDLSSRGEQKLSEYAKVESFETQVLTYGPFIYRKDWDLGDIVTVQNAKKTRTAHVRVVEVTEITEQDGFNLDAVFGQPMPTVFEKIKQDIDEPVSEGGSAGESGTPGTDGKDGIGLDYQWQGTELGVKREDETGFNFTNLKGEKGERGPQGLQGIQGETGERGPQGEKGDTGERGPQGSQGPKGDQGEQGIQGPQGDKGDSFKYIDFTPTQLSGLKGDKGDKGDQGIQGIQGIQGLKGDTGPQGEIGPEGPEGPQGEPGKDGIDGQQGPEGEIGPQGSIGETGLKGDTGPQGEIGPQGDKGPKGDKGEKGDIGPQGPQGDIGPKGEQGDVGLKGDQGIGLDYDWESTELGIKREDESTFEYVDLKGEKGDTGPMGPAGSSQSYILFEREFVTTSGQTEFSWNDGYVFSVGIHAVELYINGDRQPQTAFTEYVGGNGISLVHGLSLGQYVLIEAKMAVVDLQGPQGESIQYSWDGTQLGVKLESESSFTFVDLKGAKGDKGDKGDIGPQGLQGIQGERGPIGLTGPKGDKGETGAKGDTGERGPQGIQGELGPQGERGPIGLTGPKGDDGYTPVKGVDYFDGDKGDKGDKGDTGPPGPKGDQGDPFIYSDFTQPQLESLRGPQGIQGPQGEPGPKGDKGEPGDAVNFKPYHAGTTAPSNRNLMWIDTN